MPRLFHQSTVAFVQLLVASAEMIVFYQFSRTEQTRIHAVSIVKAVLSINPHPVVLIAVGDHRRQGHRPDKPRPSEHDRQFLTVTVCLSFNDILPRENDILKHFFFLFYNADGTLGKMCGNGLRCYLLLAYKLGMIKLDEEVCIDTLAGNMYGKVKSVNGNDGIVDENLGFPEYDCKKLEMNTNEKEWINKEVVVDGDKYKATCLELGAFHMITFMKPLDTDKANKLHAIPLFKDRINVNFAEVIDRRNIRLHTYERGVGWTLACGTGSASTAYTAYKEGRVDNKVIIHEEIGDLNIEIKDDGIHVIGPAKIVYKAEI